MLVLRLANDKNLFSKPILFWIDVMVWLKIFINMAYCVRFMTFRHNKIDAEKIELTWLYSALIKKKSCAKLIVLRLMVTHCIGNMIVLLRCHYAYLSITITRKLLVLNHNKILYYCNCHATISSSIHMFTIFFPKL